MKKDHVVNMSPNRFIITAKTSSVEIRHVFAKTGYSYLPCSLKQELSKEQLNNLIERWKSESFYNLFLQICVLHPAVDDEILEKLIKEQENNDDILSAIATSPQSSKKILMELLNAKSFQVRKHAEIALLQMELNDATIEKFENILKEYSGSEAEDISIRALLAIHPKTPIYLVEKLKLDKNNIVRERARERLLADSSHG